MKDLRNFAKYLILAVILVVFRVAGYAQTISPNIYGQNAWMPDSVGSKKYYGKLHTKWGEIKASGARIVRFGGISADREKPTKYQYIQMIDSIRAKGMEPIIQVSFHNYAHSAQQAADIVRYINIEKGRKIIYWSIGNEPDLEYSYTSASQVAPYIKSFASAMKAVDPTIKIMGPETAWYNTSIINGLTTPGGTYDITGKDANGRYYLDILSFHCYIFNGSQTSRDQVIAGPTKAGGLSENLKTLNDRLAACNSYHGRTGSAAIKTAVTEANIGYKNPSTDNLQGLGAMSFIGGQAWAEIMGIAMKRGVNILTFWSVIEGNSVALNIGYIDKYSGKRQPSYYHFKMMSENMNGTYADGTDNQTNVKAFGSKNTNGTTTVMVLNQDLNSFKYTVRLNNDAVSGTNALKININAGFAKETTGSIDGQSTTMLTFDASGNLVKRTEYKLYGNADVDKAPTVTNITTTTTGLTATITAAGATTFATGGSVMLNANTGTGITYQWNKNGVAISGATAASYKATTSGNYTVTEKTTTATATSNTITVTVTTTLTATVTASGATTFPVGGSVTLTANSGTNYLYQWKKDGVNITGATARSYVAKTAGSYQVKITQGTANAWSAPLQVTVTALTATITPQSSLSFCPGANVVLKANTGTNYTYVWKKNGTTISGATASSYTATTSGTYIVVVKYGTSTATSAGVSVNATGITATITAGGPTTFKPGESVTLKANSNSTFKYQWKKNGTNITGATASTYKATTSGDYQVKITQGTCVAWSAPMKVTVSSTITSNKEMNVSNAPDGILQVATYPNPTNGVLTIDVSTANIVEGKVKVELINYIGQVVMDKKVDVQNGMFNETFQLDPSLASGTYLLRITEGEISTVNRVIVAK